MNINHKLNSLSDELLFQDEILTKVSRSFALTIPLLPKPLKIAVTNGYLLCRVTDTIEDDEHLSIQQKYYFHHTFIMILQNKIDHQSFVDGLLPLLSTNTSPHEKTLIQHISYVLAITNALPATQKKLVKNCVITMNNLMPRFEKSANINGLKNIHMLRKYCYAVAGIVGEMLTELFCGYSKIDEQTKKTLRTLAKSFGQGLQMINILKDRWSDYDRKICWLPKDFFANEDLGPLLNNTAMQLFISGIKKLIKLNHQCLQQGLNYVLLIPNKEIGIRKFCLWAIGIAIATLNNIYNNPAFNNIQAIKISKIKLKFILFVLDRIVSNNYLLTLWFKIVTYRLARAT